LNKYISYNLTITVTVNQGDLEFKFVKSFHRSVDNNCLMTASQFMQRKSFFLNIAIEYEKIESMIF